MVTDNEGVIEAALFSDLGKSASEAQLTEIGIILGDIDYALNLLKKKVSGMAAAELKTFQPVEFLKSLRERHPYIFREEPKAAPAAAAAVETAPPVREVPVSTSPTARMRDEQIPTAPGPAAASRQEESPALDVMSLSPAEYQKYLKSKGIRDPRTMV